MSQHGRGTRDQRKEHVNHLQTSQLRGVNVENQNTMSTHSKGVPRTRGWRQPEEAAGVARMGEKKGRGGGGGGGSLLPKDQDMEKKVGVGHHSLKDQ